MKLLIVEIKQSSGPKYWYRGKIGNTYIVRALPNEYQCLSRDKDDFMTRSIDKKDAIKIGEIHIPTNLKEALA
jgi:hypothetical protein